jgi:hypothetical protein
MSISTMTTMAYRRRTDVTDRPPQPTAAGPSSAVSARLAGEAPETQTGVTSALATITAFIPTEVLITYVAVAAALTGSAATSTVGPWLNFVAFLVATPTVVWLIYAGKVRTSGKALPRAIHLWPRWEMVAATIGYVAWAFALPGTPFEQFGWYNSGVAGVSVLVAATGLGLLAPVVGRPLDVSPKGAAPAPRPGTASAAETAAASGPASAAGAASATGSAPPPASPASSAVVAPADTLDTAVPGFLPSRHGLHFANAFPHEALVSITIPGIAMLALGDAADGLCGGMAFTVRDLFEASVDPPPDTAPPPRGTARYDSLVERQLASLDLGAVALRLYELGSPLLPDGAWAVRPLADVGLAPRGRSQVMALDEWPAIKADLDAGRLSVLGLVRAIDVDPRSLGRDHQVLAYGYTLDGDALTIAIYDPNHPNDDAVRLSLSIADPSAPIAVAYSPDDGPVHCFMRIPYQAADPTAWRTT